MTVGSTSPAMGPTSNPTHPSPTASAASSSVLPALDAAAIGDQRFTTTLAVLLNDLAHATNANQAELLINDIVRHTEPLTWNLAVVLTYHYKADRNTWADEFAQCVRMAAMKLLRQIAGNPSFLAEIGSYQAVVSWRGKNEVSTFWEKNGPRSFISGQVSKSRRMGELARTRALMAAEGILDPTAEQIKERHNARMRETRKDAERQGMIAKDEDFTFFSSAPIHEEAVADEAESVSRNGGWGGDSTGEEPLLHAADRKRFVDACISACARADEDYTDRTGKRPTLPLAEVALRWFAEMVSEDSTVASLYDGPPDVKALAEEFGVSTSLVYQAVKKVRVTSGAIATEFFIGGMSVPRPRSGN